MLYYHLSPRESGLLKATGTKAATAILENDIVNKDKQEQRVRDDREGESRSESEHRTVRFLRETTVLSERKRAEDCEGLNIRV